MTLKKVLHLIRRVDSWLFAPALIVVIYGELAHSGVVDLLEANIWDKVLHFVAYFGLSLMATISVRADRRALWWALCLVLLGGALEIIQGLTGRDASILDEVSNTLGVIAALAVGWMGISFLRARNLVGTALED